MTEIYLTNKDLLAEIHLSKNSFCEFTDKKYAFYDLILESTDTIFDDATIKEAIEKRKKRLSNELYSKAMIEFNAGRSDTKPKQADYKFEDLILTEELVFRVMTFDHIPLDPTRKKTVQRNSDRYTKLNFPPFKHYVIKNLEAKELEEVGRSHSYKGQFCTTHGRITDNLGRMFILLVNRYGQRSNWNGYTYVDEMKNQALTALIAMSLHFNEFKSENPFAYFTTLISNNFIGYLSIEKKHQRIRDDLLQEAGMNPSYTRQLEHEAATRKQRESQAEQDED